MKRLTYLSAFFFLGAFSIVLWHGLTDGFHPKKLCSLTMKKVDAKPLKKELLADRYYYLAKGRQCYVFVSPKNDHVIKLYRAHLGLKGVFLHLERLWKKGEIYSSEKERHEGWVKSSEIAQKDLQKESGVFYVHPYPLKKPLKKNIELIDALGRSYLVDVSHVPFLLQKKGETLRSKMEKLLEKKEDKKIQTLIDQYVILQKTIREKGIENLDPCALRNAGMTEKGEVFDLDTGRYVYKDLEKNLKESLHKSTKSLKRFLEKKRPKWAFYLEKSIEKALEES